jgi:hypothetical protein
MSFDPSNCGSCGHACGTDQACTNGTCIDTKYEPVGPQQNVPITALRGWSLCYSDTYNVAIQAQLPNIQTACDGAKIMLACKPHANTTTISLLAWGNRSDVFFDTGAGANQGHTAGPVVWYYNGNFSWGFATAGDALNLNTCDTHPGTDRLCWHTSPPDGGYRCGDTTNLNSDASWDRLIYEAP